MLRARCTQYLAIAGLIVSGCQDVSAPAQPNPTRPAFDFGNGPATPGIVVRFTDQIGVVWTASDPVSGLTAMVGLTDLAAFCGGDFGAIQKHSVQYLFTGVGGIPAKGHEKEDVVAVYATQVPLYGDFCAALLPLTPIAQGTIRVAWLDNDVTAIGNPGGNAYQINGGGTIDDLVNGGNVHLTLHNLLYLSPGADFDPSAVRELVVRVRLGNAAK